MTISPSFGHQFQNEFILMYASKEDYFKLPGGGLKHNEDYHAACVRELMEETGCKITLDPELMATAKEWRGGLIKSHSAILHNG